MTDLFTNKNVGAVFIKKLCLLSYILVSISIWGNTKDSLSVDQDKTQVELYISEEITIAGLDFISNAKIYEIKAKINPSNKTSESKKQIQKIAQISKDPVKKKTVANPIKVNFKINQDNSVTFSSISYWSSYFVQPIPQQLNGNVQASNFKVQTRVIEENLPINQYNNSWVYELIKGSFSVRPPPSAC